MWDRHWGDVECQRVYVYIGSDAAQRKRLDRQSAMSAADECALCWKKRQPGRAKDIASPHGKQPAKRLGTQAKTYQRTGKKHAV